MKLRPLRNWKALSIATTRRRFLGPGNSKCRSLKMEVSLVCSRSSKVSVVGDSEQKERVIKDEIGEVNGLYPIILRSHGKDFGFYSKPLEEFKVKRDVLMFIF